MREIKFRGKQAFGLVKGKWVYGSFVLRGNRALIFFNKAQIQVDRETVGQYTGLKDCKRTKEFPDGQRIYEGDILRQLTPDRVVEWDMIAFTMPRMSHLSEVIGNIHEEQAE